MILLKHPKELYLAKIFSRTLMFFKIKIISVLKIILKKKKLRSSL
jgi:hypothetical protein